MSITEALVLGLVQGLTEFLPVSSSGHLVLSREWLGMKASDDISIEVVAHAGTLLSILVVMWKDVMPLVTGLKRLVAPASWRESWDDCEGFRHLVLVGLATIPTVVVYAFWKDDIKAAFNDPRLAASMLLVTAVLLATTYFTSRERPDRPLRLRPALIMGLAQAFAILPGISRSGSTISAGLAGGAERSRAGTFSFLLAIPAILGAVILSAKDIASGSSAPLPSLAACFGAAFVSGVVALVVLLELVRRGRLWWFCPYLVIVGTGYLLFT